jgi:mediator of RNA polymerase II transcription subunit 5
VESLSCFAKILMGNHLALEIMALHIRLDELIDRTATGPQFDLSAVGDPQTTVSQVGDIILFIQATILRFKILAPAIRQRMRAFDPTAGDLPRRRVDLSPDDSLVYQAWSATLFDKRSEGIEDSIFR